MHWSCPLRVDWSSGIISTSFLGYKEYCCITWNVAITFLLRIWNLLVRQRYVWSFVLTIFSNFVSYCQDTGVVLVFSREKRIRVINCKLFSRPDGVIEESIVGFAEDHITNGWSFRDLQNSHVFRLTDLLMRKVSCVQLERSRWIQFRYILCLNHRVKAPGKHDLLYRQKSMSFCWVGYTKLYESLGRLLAVQSETGIRFFLEGLRFR